MQTYSHGLIGITFGQAAVTCQFIPIENPFVRTGLAWFVGFTGAILPDVAMVPIFLYDKYVRNIQPMTDEGPITMVLKEISHSLAIWLPLLALSILFLPGTAWNTLLFVFLTSIVFAGIVPDIPTHSEERFEKTDCTFIYPLNLFTKINRVRWSNKNWEYRYDHGILWPLKTFEKMLDITVIILFIMLFILNLL